MPFRLDEFSDSLAGYLDLDAVNQRHRNGIVLSADVRNRCEAIAQLSDINVLIHGESGTGKGVVAREIADLRRSSEHIPFVALNCALLDDAQADAVLFGQRHGVVSGTSETSAGAVGQADGGVLFLDELDCLSINTQRKLLKLLDGGAYCRVGESLERRSRFQLIAASSQDLCEKVERGEFLFDVLMRIQGVEIALLPLRERQHELLELSSAYFARLQVPIRLDDLDRLVALCRPLHWPGNIRQLYKAFDSARYQAKLHCSRDYAPFFSVSPTLQQLVADRPMADRAAAGAAAATDGRMQVVNAPPTINRIFSEISQICDQRVNLNDLMETVEASLIQYAMSRNDSISGVMEHLGVSRGVLDFKRRKYNLMRSRGTPGSVMAQGRE